MSWLTRYVYEQQVARAALIASTSSVTPVLSQFSNWLMGALGAAFSLLLTNIDTITRYVWPTSFRWSLVWFGVSLLLGLVARWLSVGVVAGLTATSAVPEAGRINFLAFTKFYSSGLLWPYKCFAWGSYKAIRSGDLLAGVRYIAMQSQWQALLTLLQIVFAAISIFVLALGVKV